MKLTTTKREEDNYEISDMEPGLQQQVLLVLVLWVLISSCWQDLARGTEGIPGSVQLVGNW